MLQHGRLPGESLHDDVVITIKCVRDMFVWIHSFTKIYLNIIFTECLYRMKLQNFSLVHSDAMFHIRKMFKNFIALELKSRLVLELKTNYV